MPAIWSGLLGRGPRHGSESTSCAKNGAFSDGHLAWSWRRRTTLVEKSGPSHQTVIRLLFNCRDLHRAVRFSSRLSRANPTAMLLRHTKVTLRHSPVHGAFVSQVHRPRCQQMPSFFLFCFFVLFTPAVSEFSIRQFHSEKKSGHALDSWIIQCNKGTSPRSAAKVHLCCKY